MYVPVYTYLHIYSQCVHAQILIKKSSYFEDKYEDRVLISEMKDLNQILTNLSSKPESEPI